MAPFPFIRLALTVVWLISLSVVRGFVPATSHRFLRSFFISRYQPVGAAHGNILSALHATTQQTSKGFGKPKADRERSTPSSTTSSRASEKGIYSLPALYDLAFSYRNFEEEVNFLIQSHETHSSSNEAGIGKAPPIRILELAAGPARHCLTALTRENKKSPIVESVTAVDLSLDMKEYAMQLARESKLLLSNDDENEHQGDQECAFRYICADMRQPVLENNGGDATSSRQRPFDSVWILLGSLQHLQTNEDVISCFQSANQALRPGGTLILELPHPTETFSMVECTKNSWQVPLEDKDGKDCGELQIVWGDDTDSFDPIRQVRQFSVSFDLIGTSEKDRQRVRQTLPMRLFTAQEIDALARCSGFKVEAMYGALDKDVNVDDEDEAFRLVCVLRKIEP